MRSLSNTFWALVDRAHLNALRRAGRSRGGTKLVVLLLLAVVTAVACALHLLCYTPCEVEHPPPAAPRGIGGLLRTIRLPKRRLDSAHMGDAEWTLGQYLWRC